MANLTAHDRRQLKRMSERLGLFTKGEVSLRVLIADIEFLLGALEAIDDRTRQQLREKWEVLEEVYAVTLAMQEGQFDARALSLVHDSVTVLRARIEELIGTSAPSP